MNCRLTAERKCNRGVETLKPMFWSYILAFVQRKPTPIPQEINLEGHCNTCPLAHNFVNSSIWWNKSGCINSSKEWGVVPFNQERYVRLKRSDILHLEIKAGKVAGEDDGTRLWLRDHTGSESN